MRMRPSRPLRFFASAAAPVLAGDAKSAAPNVYRPDGVFLEDVAAEPEPAAFERAPPRDAPPPRARRAPPPRARAAGRASPRSTAARGPTPPRPPPPGRARSRAERQRDVRRRHSRRARRRRRVVVVVVETRLRGSAGERCAVQLVDRPDVRVRPGGVLGRVRGVVRVGVVRDAGARRSASGSRGCPVRDRLAPRARRASTRCPSVAATRSRRGCRQRRRPSARGEGTRRRSRARCLRGVLVRPAPRPARGRTGRFLIEASSAKSAASAGEALSVDLSPPPRRPIAGAPRARVPNKSSSDMPRASATYLAYLARGDLRKTVKLENERETSVRERWAKSVSFEADWTGLQL